MKHVRSALRSSLRATKSRRSAPVLAGVALGAVLAVGTAVPASAASITTCSLSPAAATVEPLNSPAAVVSWTPGGLRWVWIEFFYDEDPGFSGPFPLDQLTFAIGEEWSEVLAGSTFRMDIYAATGNPLGEKVGVEPLCTMTVTYASAGGGDFDLDIDRERYLGRSSSVAELPDTV
jgi:hypothetical protein